MLTNFLIKKISVLLITLLLCAVISMDSFGQSCPACGTTTNTKTYNISSSLNVDEGNNNQNANNWTPSGSPSSSEIARFNNPNTYTWIPTNTTNIKGLILENNANLILDRSGQGSTPTFIIGGTSESDKGCIVVNSGSTLTLKYISNLINVNICVEPGGEIIFDSRREDRNDFLFNNVEITLQGPDAKISFGEADIIVGTGGVTVIGYSGSPGVGCSRDSNGDLVYPNPMPNISADPTKTDIDDYCNFLARAGFSINPVDYLSFTSNHNSSDRSNEINWVTASEKENSHFIIQRSVNDVKSWEDIGEVSGAINSEIPIAYDFTDSFLPLAGGNMYYRLKQLDLEGKSSLGEVISVRVGGISDKGTWRVFSNPNNGEAIRLELLHKEKYKGEEVSIRLLSNYNSLENKQIVTKDIFDLSSQLQQLLSPIGKGVAVLEIIWGNQVEHIKILKK